MLPTDEIAPGYRPDADPSPAGVPCVTADGRRWVLKPLPADCLHGDAIHPAIRERLARVRELPHARVATLAGVVRGTAGGAHLVWAWVDGLPWDRADVPAARFPAVARQLATAVETLHARGLVHGGLTPGNVIVTPAGDVWLTHVSPYLWADPADDVRAVVELLRPPTAALGLPPPDVADPPPAAALHDLAGRWAPGSTAAPPAVNGHGRRSLWAAAAVAALAAVTAVGVARWAVRSSARPSPGPVPQLVPPPR